MRFFYSTEILSLDIDRILEKEPKFMIKERETSKNSGKELGHEHTDRDHFPITFSVNSRGIGIDRGLNFPSLVEIEVLRNTIYSLHSVHFERTDSSCAIPHTAHAMFRSALDCTDAKKYFLHKH